MRWKEWPSWVKGGIIVSLLSLIVLPLILFIELMLGRGFDLIEGVIGILAPFIYTSLFFGFSKGFTIGITYLVFGIIFTLIQYFIIGAILGVIYGKSNYKKTTVTIFIIVYVIFVSYLLYIYQPNVIYNKNSVEECKNKFNLLLVHFNENECLVELAKSKLDITICDRIDKDPYNTNGPEDTKWFCYEEVARRKDDSSICSKILNNRLGRRDGCYLIFKMCDKIESDGWRKNCYEFEVKNKRDDK